MDRHTPLLNDSLSTMATLCADLEAVSAPAFEAVSDGAAALVLQDCVEAGLRWKNLLVEHAGVPPPCGPSWGARLKMTWIIIKSSVSDQAAIVATCREHLARLQEHYRETLTHLELPDPLRRALRAQQSELETLAHRLQCLEG